KDQHILHFQNLFFLAAYVVIAVHLAWGGGFDLNFMQLILLVGVFYLVGFIKVALYTAFLNSEKALFSLKEVWLLSALSLYPVFIILPLGAFLGEFLSLFSEALGMTFFYGSLLGAFIYVNILRVRYMKQIFHKRGSFVWLISLSEIVLFFITSLVLFMLGMTFVIKTIENLLKGIY
ncbi:MAG: hypothetical protein CVV50_03085, partial [Spirochaetae bacterium HGW-Spirochaetae-6]